MKVPAIRKLVNQYSVDELQSAEEALYEEKPMPIEVEGKDEGEQLTHVIAALWIKNDMAQNNLELGKSLRNYTQKVRSSID
jgi:tetrahydromethanopterin S-methyltransferase subunit A